MRRSNTIAFWTVVAAVTALDVLSKWWAETGLLPQRLESDGRVRFVMPSLDLVAGTYRVDAAVHTRNGRAFDYRRGVLRFVVGSRVHDIGVYRPKHQWKVEGGITFKQIDVAERNVPSEIAEAMRAAQPGRKKK